MSTSAIFEPRETGGAFRLDHLLSWLAFMAAEWLGRRIAAGEPGMRIALPNARIMVHQPSGGARGMASDIEIQAREILRMRKRLNDLYAKYTGKSLDEIEKAMDRDTFLEADEAMAFGIVDKVFETRPESEVTTADSEGQNSGSGGAPE